MVSYELRVKSNQTQLPICSLADSFMLKRA